MTSACCHLTLRDLPSLFATFAASRETSVLSITPHAEDAKGAKGRCRGIIPTFAHSRVRPECPSQHATKVSKIR
ncbi:protein of unknown function [Methanoculleus bourgensis]|uniref:Uncharacterized protein n=1 Tax=Methanoculleus bourgensis TaxID=83986 RepID=A0A0X3BPT7_9EURY|nr:protein of unknown function [Methanoculleus bourgensis]